MTELQALRIKHETLRQEIIARDGEIQIGKSYPELEAIATEIFYCLTGGAATLIFTADEIKAMTLLAA